MADRIDDQSDKNVAKYAKGGDGKIDADDTWANLVKHLTGYPMPPRSTLFENLTSDYGGPLFRMDIQDRAIEDVMGDSGFEMNDGEDYDIWFFSDSGNGNADLKQARIVFEGTAQDEDGNIIWADTSGETAADIAVGGGAEFTDYNDDKMSNVAVKQYSNGPRDALLYLRNGNTEGMWFGGIGVPSAGVVDLESFDAAGDSFDRAAKFFRDYAPKIKAWEDALGKDGATWQGESADIFRSLLTKTRENYEGYIDTFDGSGEPTGDHRTVYSRALADAKAELKDAAQRLLDAWQKWAQSPFYDPIHVLRYVLDDLAMWVEENNIKQTHISVTTVSTGRTVSSYTTAETKPDFLQDHPKYGDLTDKASWKKVGEEAVRIWDRGVDDYLVGPAAAVQSDLNNKFLDLGEKFTEHVPEPQTTSSAAADYVNDKTDAANDAVDDANKQIQDMQDQIDEIQDEADEAVDEANSQAEKAQEQANEQIQEMQDEAEARAREQEQQMNQALDDLNNPGGGNPGGLGGTLGGAFPATRYTVTGGLNGLNSGGRNPGSGKGGTLRSLLPHPDGKTGLRTPTGGRTSLNDGIFQTTFPGGEYTSFDPQTGLLTTAGPEGNIGSTDLTHGASVTNPDGSVTSLDGGQLTTEFPDGSRQVINPDTGAVTSIDPQGRTTTTDLGSLAGLNDTGGHGGLDDLRDLGQQITTQSTGDLGGLNGTGGTGSGLETPTGGRTSLDGGEFRTTFPGGEYTSFDPQTGLLTTAGPEGNIGSTDLTHGASVTNPDGSVTSLDGGQLTTEFPDGSRQVINPDTGAVTSIDPQGHTTTTDLGSLAGLNDTGGHGGLDDLGGPEQRSADLSLGDVGGLHELSTTAGAGAGSGSRTTENLGSLGGLSGASSSGDGTVLGGGTDGLHQQFTAGGGQQFMAGGDQQPAAGATGRPGPPGTPMPPMSGMGAGGDKGNGERVRAVLTDSLERNQRRGGAQQWGRGEESDTFLSPASRPTTTGGHDGEPAVAASGRPSVTGAFSSDAAEDEDVWGTDAGGVPNVIGR